MALPESIAGAAGVALFLAAGMGLVELLPALRARLLGERLGLAYLLGVTWTAGGLYAISHLLAVPLGRPAVLALALLPAAAGLGQRLLGARRPRNRAFAAKPTLPPAEHPAPAPYSFIVPGSSGSGDPPAAMDGAEGEDMEERAGAERPPFPGEALQRDPAGNPVRRSRRAARLALVVGGVVSLAVWAEAVTNPVRDWDGRMTWVTQARYVRAERTVDAAVLRGEPWYVTHPRYPLLLPLAQVAVLELTGRPDDSHSFRALYAAFFPAYLLVLYAGARRWTGRRAAALTTLAAALVPFLPFYDAGGAAGAYSDLPLACFYGAGLLLLLDRRPSLAAGLAAGLLLAGAALAKNEGALLAVWALALGSLAALLQIRKGSRRRNPEARNRPADSAETGTLEARSHPEDLDRAVPASDAGAVPRPRRPLGPWLARLAAAALPVALAVALLASWRAGIPNRYDERYDEIATLGTLLPGTVRSLPVIAPVVLRTMLSGPHWSLLWWIAPLILWVGRRGLRRRVAVPLALAALAPPAIAWGAYAVFPNPGFLAAVTWNRFVVQASLPGLWLLALALCELLAAPLPVWTRRPLRLAGLELP